MKDSLIRHIKQIFEALKIKAEYKVFDINADILPDWLHGVELTHEFIACCDATFKKETLQNFIHKDIIQIDNHYIWFEGKSHANASPVSKETIDTLIVHPDGKLKTTTRVPSWLDNFIFSTLNAEYSPDFQKFEHNLKLSHEDNLKYLGTYFPRSYTESFCIFDNIFSNDVIKSKYAYMTEISILSIGCGTGGDIIGLLTIINKHFASIKKIKVYAVDGNEDAINIMSQIVQQAQKQFHKEIVLFAKHVIFDKISAIDTNASFDFIITSKLINEIINIGNGNLDNSYYDFAKAYSPMLKIDGFMLILDVTTKVGASNFCPILLNRQVNQFVSEHTDFVSIIPIPCSNKGDCQEQCFSQIEFTVTHSMFENDKSRVAYRILVKKSLSQELQLAQPNTQYQIHPEKYCGRGLLVADGFCLPSKEMISVDDKIAKKEDEEISLKHTATIQLIQDLKVQKEVNDEKSQTTQQKQLGEAYVIDTNAFIYAPNIIEKIADKYPIFISAKVVDELDHRKDVTSGNDKKRVQKALRSINLAITNGRVNTITSDARLLPADFDRRSPDNLILSVVLKIERMGYIPTLVTSDNGFQAKAKTLKIRTISYSKVKTKM